MRSRRWAILLTLLLMTSVFAARAGAQPAQLQVTSRRDCAICHIEWAESFDHPHNPLLIDRPEKPQVSAEETCLGCHDGSVGDSRRAVWRDHGHKTGQAPPPGMTIPDKFPLDDGKIACRTCHTAHALKGGERFDEIVFLRARNDQSQMCIMCHGEKPKGMKFGSHPMGEMSVELPPALKEAGASAGPDNKTVTCQSCHEAHGSRVDNLLVLGTNSSQLCVGCHDKLKPGMWRPEARHDHPLNPPLTSQAQIDTIRRMGTKIGKDNTLICLSCHKMHDALPGKEILADTLSGSKLCISCHPDRAEMLGSKHDLRNSAPEETNRQGQTAQQSGPCGACHSFHSYARDHQPTAEDPGGLCVTCHASGKVAEKAGARKMTHPVAVDPTRLPADLQFPIYSPTGDGRTASVSCLTCHDPHSTKATHFLRKQRDDLCATCHTETRTLAGKHDFTARSDLKNALGLTAAQTGKCGFCHSVHQSNGVDMWAGTSAAPTSADGLCQQCHREGGMAAGQRLAPLYSHPTGPQKYPATRPSTVKLPLYDTNGHRAKSGYVSCASCHNPHSDSNKSKLMLRVQGPTSELCIQCHADEGTLAGSKHDPASKPQAWPRDAQQNENDLCMNCHRAHSNDRERGLWAMKPATGGVGSDNICLSCHPGSAWATNRPVAGAMMHPETIAPISKSRPPANTLPLIFDQKTQSPDTIGCKTCHNPHAPSYAPALLRSTSPTNPAGVCFNCHPETRSLTASMHAPDVLGKQQNVPANRSRLSCGPCHATHAVEGSYKTDLWAAKLDADSEQLVQKRCLGCHDGLYLKRPELVKHPAADFGLVALRSAQPTDLQRAVAAAGTITCATCHLPHGRDDLFDDQTPSPALRSAAKPMLRPNVAQEICSTCHGSVGTQLLLYYHKPDQRADLQEPLTPWPIVKIKPPAPTTTTAPTTTASPTPAPTTAPTAASATTSTTPTSAPLP